MAFSTKIGRAFGIDVFVHWSFILIPILVGWSALSAGQGVVMALLSLAFTLAVFGCVLMHEFGHALMARKFGVQTRDIILLPIGGLARLERMPRRPIHELLIAIAGPAVNLVIVAMLLAVLFPFIGMSGLLSPGLSGGGFFVSLLYANLLLAVFNMLPAFPMDGGRVLRSILAMVMDYKDATKIAARCGQVMALLIGGIGLAMTNFALLFIAGFVFFAAGAELRSVAQPRPAPIWYRATTRRQWEPTDRGHQPGQQSQYTQAHPMSGKDASSTSQDGQSTRYKVKLPNGSILIVEGFKGNGS